jgi:HPt (histidine-containing phosphotransfer) domain-containing protein
LKISSLVAWLAGLLLSIAATAAPSTLHCDSCDIQVHSLDQPVKLTGGWLFTRDDLPANKDANADTSKWVVIKAPGPWKHAYADHKNFEIGWYRGVMHFDPSLVGQDAVLLINTYMARTEVFVDGQSVFRRPDPAQMQRYYSIQPVPARFKITKPEMVVAFRVDTPLMTGVYQLPLELRKAQAHDAGLLGYEVWGGELRLVVGLVAFMFGLFFLLVFAKTRYPMYLVAALCGIGYLPFLLAPADAMVALFSPEPMLYLHYLGLGSMFFFYPFCQFFDRFYPKTNWFFGVSMGLMGLTIASMAVHPNLDLFQHVRSVYFVSFLLVGLLCLYTLARGVKAKKPHAKVLLAAMVFFVFAGTHDMLLALGAISSLSMIFTGATVFIGAMLYVASNIFADTFVQNKQLVRDLQGMNDNLEQLVAERTLQLRQKTHDIESMLQNMPQGVLTILANNEVHPEYSAYLETILETGDIADRNVMELLFANSMLGSEALSQLEAAASSCIGEDRMNFEFNSHLMVPEFDLRMADGRVKSLALSWSPICDDNDVIEKLMLCVRDVTELKRLAAEAGAQRRELEIIGQVLAVSQEKWHEFVRGSREFLKRNRELVQACAQRDDKVLQELFRNMHTIKGNGRTYGLLVLTQVVHDAEQALDALRHDANAVWDRDALLADLDAVEAALDEYARVNDQTLGRRGPGRRGSVERFLMVEKAQVADSLKLIRSVDPQNANAMRDALREVGQTLSLIGTEPLEHVLGGTIGSLPSLAAELGKEAPTVTVVDRGVRVRSQIAGTLRNVFTHLLRNSVDHGLESVPERLAKGKKPAGEITIGLSLQDVALRITVGDDGRGLSLSAIRAKAVERGLIAADAAMNDHDLANLIFLSGFSTAQKLTEVSGRGVGMDAVRDFLKGEGGAIDIQFTGEAGADGFRPFELVISLPARFAMQTREWRQLSDLPEFSMTMPAPLEAA